MYRKITRERAMKSPTFDFGKDTKDFIRKLLPKNEQKKSSFFDKIDIYFKITLPVIGALIAAVSACNNIYKDSITIIRDRAVLLELPVQNSIDQDVKFIEDSIPYVSYMYLNIICFQCNTEKLVRAILRKETRPTMVNLNPIYAWNKIVIPYPYHGKPHKTCETTSKNPLRRGWIALGIHGEPSPHAKVFVTSNKIPQDQKLSTKDEKLPNELLELKAIRDFQINTELFVENDLIQLQVDINVRREPASWDRVRVLQSGNIACIVSIRKLNFLNTFQYWGEVLFK